MIHETRIPVFAAAEAVGEQHFVVIGTTTTARRVCATLRDHGCTVQHLAAPGDDDLRAALAAPPVGIAILVHQDEVALRYALAAAHLAPHARLVATMFDATMSRELGNLLPGCILTSPGVLGAPMLAAACLSDDVGAIVGAERGTDRLLQPEDGAVVARTFHRAAELRWRILVGRIGGQLRPHDAGTYMLFAGLTGIACILGIDLIWRLAKGASLPEAFLEGVRVVATVGPATSEGDSAYAVFSGFAMLLTVVFTGMFTAGLVELLLGPRLVGIFGPRALPRSGHVIVVGVGQVGLRLARELVRLRIPVVAVERDADARYVRVARRLGIPVVIGHGGDRVLLERLGVHRALALAAVGSDDLDNIAVAVAARGTDARTRIVLRAGEHEAMTETSSLLPLGATRNVTELSAAYVTARLLGVQASLAIPDRPYVLVGDLATSFARWRTSKACAHAE